MLLPASSWGGYNLNAQESTNYLQQSQSSEPYGWEKSPRYRGFVGDSFLVGTGDAKNWDGEKLWTSHGCLMTPYLYLGIGVGIEFWCKDFDFGNHLWNAPVFLHGRGEFHKTFRNNVSPYWDARMGYSAGDTKGFYISPSIGCHFSFGHSVCGLSVGIGYEATIHDVRHDLSYGNGYDTSAAWGGLELTVAFDF